MIQYPRSIRNFNAFIDGISYAGRVAKGTLPELKMLTEGFRGAGMDQSVAQDMGTEAMAAKISLKEWAPELQTLYGTRRSMTFRPAALGEDNFEATTFVATLNGRWSAIKYPDLEAGKDMPIELQLEVDYFRMESDGNELFEIDVRAGKRVIGGVDQLASLRAAMGQ